MANAWATSAIIMSIHMAQFGLHLMNELIVMTPLLIVVVLSRFWVIEPDNQCS
jgi:hypothetical protein